MATKVLIQHPVNDLTKNGCYGLILTALLFCGASSAYAASFDCKKASTKHEKLICGTPQLDAADAQMGEAYKTAVNVFPVKGFIQADQRRWIRDYQRCEIAEKCLKQVMERISELSAYSKSSVYTDSKESKFMAQDAMLIFYEKNSKSFVRLFGYWMPDAFLDPAKMRGYPHDGFICDEELELIKKGDRLTAKEDSNVLFVIDGSKVTMKGSVACNARTSFVEGVYSKK